ncbi:MAG: extracellular solute-binding protein [bacterium]|nr:extracellular solute-binding protein [bacterium]
MREDRGSHEATNIWSGILNVRSSIRCVGLCIALCGLAGPAAGDASDEQGRTITVATWGGPYERSQVKAYFEPFTKATDIRVRTVRYEGGLSELRQQLGTGEITWDVVDMTMADNRAACRQGLLEPIDHAILLPGTDGVPADEDFLDGALTECGVSQIVYAMVTAFNRDAFPGERPARIEDIFDVKRFPGKRALQKAPAANLEWALVSYGVPREDLYELLSTERGLRLAFRKLDRIRDHVIWWTSIDEPVDLLVSGKVAIASQFNGRLFDAAVVHGHPIEIIWDAQLYEFGTWGVTRGSPRRKEALEFIRFATGTGPLADQAGYISYGPTRHSSTRLVSTHAEIGVDMRPHLPTSSANFRTAILKDTEWYASLHDRIVARFDAWLGQSETNHTDQATTDAVAEGQDDRSD